SWLVKYLSTSSANLATLVLSLFWGGLTLGRLLSRWVVNRLNGLVFTVGCMVSASVSLIIAGMAPSLPLRFILFGIGGLLLGPIYPMLMTIGGGLYPSRLATLSGGLAGAAILGAVVYPPLMGVVAANL